MKNLKLSVLISNWVDLSRDKQKPFKVLWDVPNSLRSWCAWKASVVYSGGSECQGGKKCEWSKSL